MAVSFGEESVYFARHGHQYHNLDTTGNCIHHQQTFKYRQLVSVKVNSL